MAEQAKPHWSLDRRIPLALILTLALQTGGAIWWASGVNSRVNTIERDAGKIEVITRQNSNDIRKLETGAARQDARLSEILRLVQAIDRRLSTAER